MDNYNTFMELKWPRILADIVSNFNCEESVRHLTTHSCVYAGAQTNIQKRYRPNSYIPTKRLKCTLLSSLSLTEDKAVKINKYRSNVHFIGFGEIEKVSSHFTYLYCYQVIKPKGFVRKRKFELLFQFMPQNAHT